MAKVARIALRGGGSMPVLGQGTWRFGEDPARRADEVAALRLGLDLGLAVVDTAEMYGDGASEERVAEAIGGRRDEVFLVSKVLPSHATRRGVVRACEGSLRRLRTDRLDLYLLHWRGATPLEETVAGFADLVRAGKIRAWGVSNLDVSDLEELVALRGGAEVASDQVLYNPSRRGVEHDLLPWCRARGVAVMAYSPLQQGALLGNRALREVGRRHGATAVQVALAWAIRGGGVCAIPEARTPAHVRENRAALELLLGPEDLAALDRAFPPPARKVPLEII
ncbi:aldo/keto reductase [Anaeromyxobacter oryzisoli]|uniref:aldo/keto reductase n=1 Tax=Anaeromyxobacter oryzisoli TaxID=2925408 RepID=UPI001F58447A|nr:aldo/keto reductase [Anaeromyxobacter sp. SG63]